jgi:hypothetical protein
MKKIGETRQKGWQPQDMFQGHQLACLVPWGIIGEKKLQSQVGAKLLA